MANRPDLVGPFCPIGHILSMNSRVQPEYKTKYRVSNWADYDRALVLRLVFRLPLRQAEGFLRSALSLMALDLEAVWIKLIAKSM